MTQQSRGKASHAGGAMEKDRSGDNQEDGLKAEQESAAAMDADVPQPPDADKTTEGQPS